MILGKIVGMALVGLIVIGGVFEGHLDLAFPLNGSEFRSKFVGMIGPTCLGHVLFSKNIAIAQRTDEKRSPVPAGVDNRQHLQKIVIPDSRFGPDRNGKVDVWMDDIDAGAKVWFGKFKIIGQRIIENPQYAEKPDARCRGLTAIPLGNVDREATPFAVTHRLGRDRQIGPQFLLGVFSSQHNGLVGGFGSSAGGIGSPGSSPQGHHQKYGFDTGDDVLCMGKPHEFLCALSHAFLRREVVLGIVFGGMFWLAAFFGFGGFLFGQSRLGRYGSLLLCLSGTFGLFGVFSWASGLGG